MLELALRDQQKQVYVEKIKFNSKVMDYLHLRSASISIKYCSVAIFVLSRSPDF